VTAGLARRQLLRQPDHLFARDGVVVKPEVADAAREQRISSRRWAPKKAISIGTISDTYRFEIFYRYEYAV
jgi:hypothetical protein